MCKKILCAVLTLVLLIGLVPAAAIPASAAAYADCNVFDNTLLISGSGSIKLTGGKPSWESEKDTIEDIKFDLSGPVVIPEGAFTTAGYTNLKSVHVNKINHWLGSSFGGVNPLFAGGKSHNFYIGDKIVSTLEIPNKTVHIADNAFYGSTIEKVILPGTVKRIGVSAFENCYQMSSINLPNSIEIIKTNAFAGTGLTSVNLPDKLTVLQNGAFQNCKSLTTVDGSSKLTSGMGTGVFKGCEKLSVVSLPSELTVIPTSAFEDCKVLSNINIPSKVSMISADAFKNTALKGVSFPKSLKFLEGSAFTGCDKLSYINVPSIKVWCEMDITGVNPLNQAKYLKVEGKDFSTLNIPGDIVQIPSDRFVNCRNITKVVVPNSVKTIGSGAFKHAENITEVVLGSSVQKIEEDAFLGCGKIKTVTCDKKQWAERLSVAAGNDNLVNAYNGTHTPPSEPSKPDAYTTPVSKELAAYVASMHTFRKDAYEFPKDSGQYLIGYGTSSVKGAQITPDEARLVLQEEDLAIAAGNVAHYFSGLTATELEALASYTFRNGYDWMKNAAHPLSKAISGKYDEFQFLEAICSGTKPGSAEFNRRLRDGNLFINGKYASEVPANYGYVTLDANGGELTAGYIIFDKKLAAGPIADTYNPTLFHQKFVGWFTQKQTGKLVTYLDGAYHGMTLYAHWQHDESSVPGAKPVSYKLPTVMVDSSCLDAATNRVRVYAEPTTASKHIQTIENNTLMSIVAEYKDTAGNLWVKIKNSGWVSLGTTPMGVVEPGTVELSANQRLNVFETYSTSSKRVASLRDDNLVSVVQRQKVGDVEWARVWFLDSEDDIYKTGWVDLSHIALDKTPGPVDPDVKTPIAKGVVVDTANVNVRGTPNVHGEFYCQLPNGTQFTIYEYATTNGVQWALTDMGWVCMQYVKLIEDGSGNNGSGSLDSGNMGSDTNTVPLAKGKVIGSLVLNVRSAPGAHNKKTATLTGGTEMSIYQTKMFNGAQWGRMEKGWVCLTYIQLDGDLVAPEGESGSKPATLGQARVVDCSTHVNVRASATPQSALQGTYPLGSMIELMEHTTNNGFDWYRTAKGWVCGKYLKKVDAPVVPIVPTPGNPGSSVVPGTPAGATVGTVVGTQNVNVRQDAGVYNAKVGSLRGGSRVNIKGSKVVDGVTWYQIDQGWVSSEYVQVGGGEIIGGNGNPVIGGTTETTNGKFATGTIAQAGTKVRTGPGYGYKDVKSLKLGEKITIYEQQLLDGVAWGRINNTNWVNLAFVTLDTTGITGTGTIGTIARCGHAINIRRSPSVNSARMATIVLGATVEILETKDMGVGGIWGRTPQGWVHMRYVQLTGEIPAPPLNPDTNVPNPAPDTNTPAPNPEQQKPADRGIPFDMKGTTNDATDLQIIPGILGEYDAKIGNKQPVVITKLDSVDDKMWGLVQGGWIDLQYVDLSNFVVSNTAQIVWNDASTTTAVSVINKGDVKNIEMLKMDAAKKVWGKIDTGWIELTQITELGNYSTSFLVKATTNAVTKVYTFSDKTSEVVLEELPANTAINITALSYDAQIAGKGMMAKIDSGWIDLSVVSLPITAHVTPQMLATWNEMERSTPKGFLHNGDVVTIGALGLTSSGVPMAYLGTNGWVELSTLVTP